MERDGGGRFSVIVRPDETLLRLDHFDISDLRHL
jgi:hypothetical protein